MTLDSRQQFVQSPNMIRDASRHRRPMRIWPLPLLYFLLIYCSTISRSVASIAHPL
ncbi:MAG: hypothetical protein ABSH08_19510 [Tepidisphaeraceae bacterium]